MSGGSSSLLSTPAWFALGYPLPVAIAADKVAATFWASVSARNYLRGRSVDRRLLIGMMLAGLVGAVLGARVTAVIDPHLLRRVVGALIALAAVGVALRPAFGQAAREPRLGRRGALAAAVPLGFYEGMLGSGNSVLTTLVLCVGRGLDLPRALGHYYAMAVPWCVLAAITYAGQGFFDLALAIPVFLGAGVGGYLGSRIGSSRGAGFLRVVFVVAALAVGGVLAVAG